MFPKKGTNFEGAMQQCQSRLIGEKLGHQNGMVPAAARMLGLKGIILVAK
jgi:hypothetical protein